MALRAMVFGGNGNLANRILQRFPEFKRVTKEECDVCDYHKVDQLIFAERPEYVINCAAITDVDLCESEVKKCWDVNYFAVKKLAESSVRYGAHLVHFSSDYAVDPVNQYGIAKQASERVAIIAGLVIRTNMYDEKSYIIRNLLASKPINAFDDVIFNPISTFGVIDNLFAEHETIVNVGTNRPITMYEFALTVCKVFSIDPALVTSQHFNNDFPACRKKNLFIRPYNDTSIEDDLRRFRDEIKK